MKKLFTVLLIVCMALSFTGCKKVDKLVDTSEMTYAEQSEYFYNRNFGDFITAYKAAEAEKNDSKRWALEAIAEAKLMESGMTLPTYTQLGTYAISRLAPYTRNSCLWGSDTDRYTQAVVTTEPIKISDRDVMKAKYLEVKGTGTYIEWAKQYLKDQGYTLKDSYTYNYTSDVQTWDGLATSRAADGNAICFTVENLIEYDAEGVARPALATSWEISDDGITYTFHIREGVKWVDSKGQEIGEVTAQDFVDGMQHAMDAQGGTEYLVQGVIVNVSEYIDGTVTDMAEVGVKAVDKYTLQYTLTEPHSYFLTMMNYSIFTPLCKTYFESKGGKLGLADYNPETTIYGRTFEDIAYCGPYLVTNVTANNTVAFVANEKYWNRANIGVSNIIWKFNDGTDVTKAYNDCISGVIDYAPLNVNTIAIAKADGNFDTITYTDNTNATTFINFYNVNRKRFANLADANACVSTKTDEEKVRTYTAINNKHFRLAVSMGYDRATANAQGVGEDLKYNTIRNSYTPATFVSLTEEVTVKINGKDVTYPAGTYYGKIMQDQIDADGVKIKVYDAEKGTGDGYDGWYNPENAVAELEIAIKELAEQDIVIDAEHPIYLDLPTYVGSVLRTNRSNAFKQSVEAALGGKVIINIVACETSQAWYDAGYYTDYGYDANYDIYDVSGWGPDYGDPATYLDTMLPDGAGYMVKCTGIY